MASSKKARAEVLLAAEQISLAKVLASNDKAIRDKGVKRLGKWIAARSGIVEFTKQDLMTIWKGLFYCMWMADKPLYQEELAERIANLIHSFNKLEEGLLYMECFLLTMRREWFGVDQHRLDKFMMLVRRCIRQLFVYCSSHSWPQEACEGISNLLERGITSSAESTPSLGLLFHVADVILEELAKAESPEKGLQAVLLPFATLIAFSKDGRVRQHASERVFHHLIQQSPLGIEFQEKFEAWKQAGFPGDSWRDMERVDISDEEEQKDNEHIESEQGEKYLDPRAGKVDIELPTIDFDPVEVAALLKSQMQKTSNIKQRKVLNVLASQYLMLSNGQYPLGFKKPAGCTVRRNRAKYQKELWKAAEDLVEYEEEHMNPEEDDEISNTRTGQKRKHQNVGTEVVQTKRRKVKLSKIIKAEENASDTPTLQNSSVPKKLRKNDQDISKQNKSARVASRKQGDKQDNCNLVSKVTRGEMFHNYTLESRKAVGTSLWKENNENEDLLSKIDSESENVAQLSDKSLRRKKKRRISSDGVDDQSSIAQPTCTVVEMNKLSERGKMKHNRKSKTGTEKNDMQQSSGKLADITPSKLGANSGDTEVVLFHADGQLSEPDGKKKLNGVMHGQNVRGRNSMNVVKVKTANSSPLLRSASKISPKRRKSLPSWIVTDIPQPLRVNNSSKENTESAACTAATTPTKVMTPVKTPKSTRGMKNEEKYVCTVVKPLLKSTPQTVNSFTKTPTSSKKVNIVLNKNIAHEDHDYQKAVKQSPNVPFDANKKPIQGVLKPSHTPSPINPFYRKSKRLKM